jgi:hypothetical protein
MGVETTQVAGQPLVDGARADHHQVRGPRQAPRDPLEEAGEMLPAASVEGVSGRPAPAMAHVGIVPNVARGAMPAFDAGHEALEHYPASPQACEERLARVDPEQRHPSFALAG